MAACAATGMYFLLDKGLLMGDPSYTQYKLETFSEGICLPFWGGKTLLNNPARWRQWLG